MDKDDHAVAHEEKAAALDDSSEEQHVHAKASFTLKDKIALASLCILWVGAQNGPNDLSRVILIGPKARSYHSISLAPP